MMNDPLVSVIMITYGHEKFIRDAINGVLLQVCDFNFELIVSNDNSPDNTDQIIMETLKNDHSNSVKYFKQEENLGMMPNLLFACSMVKGKYIALCDGDDFWTDPNKLQKQISFLEENEDYSICFHNVEERYENTYNKASFLYCNPNQKETTGIMDLAENNYIPTCSAVFRKNEIFNKFPDWFSLMNMGDWILHFFNAKYGKIKYIPHVMGVHRIHDGGIWSSIAIEKMLKHIVFAYDHLIEYSSEDIELKMQLERSKINIVKKLSNQRGNKKDYIKKIFINIMPYGIVRHFKS